MLKMLGGAFLAFLALQHQIPSEQAVEPTQMYLAGFGYVFARPGLGAGRDHAVRGRLADQDQPHQRLCGLAGLVQLLRAAHAQPSGPRGLAGVQRADRGAADDAGRVRARSRTCWASTATSRSPGSARWWPTWSINKPLGWSPKHIEFKRAHLYDINPVGLGAMLVAALLGIVAYAGALGPLAQAFSPFIALLTALLVSPLLAWWTRGRYYLARSGDTPWAPGQSVTAARSARTPSSRRTWPTARPTTRRSARCAARWSRAAMTAARPARARPSRSTPG